MSGIGSEKEAETRAASAVFGSWSARVATWVESIAAPDLQPGGGPYRRAAAESQYREQMRPDHHPYYGRVVRSAGYVVLQYWFFYDLRRRWDDSDLTLVGEHPVVHPGLGSHSGAYLAGEYLTTFEGQAFHRLIKMFRAINRALLPWTRDRAQAGVGIPYIDYSRGDGVSIGPGQQREWQPVLVDETTPWLTHYRGLWGNDTEDPLGGERGPAGPRYERSTAVRASWGDPVGWSGLRKIAPNPEAADLMQRVYLAGLDDEITALESQIAARQTAIRAEAASGETVSTNTSLSSTASANPRLPPGRTTISGTGDCRFPTRNVPADESCRSGRRSVPRSCCCG